MIKVNTAVKHYITSALYCILSYIVYSLLNNSNTKLELCHHNHLLF